MELEELQIKIDELIYMLNQLSYQDLIKNKEEISNKLVVLDSFTSDFLNLVNCKNKPLEFEKDDYPFVSTQRDEIIKLLRENPGYYNLEQICYCVVGSKDGIRSIMRTLVNDGIVIRSHEVGNRLKLIWRIARK